MSEEFLEKIDDKLRSILKLHQKIPFIFNNRSLMLKEDYTFLLYFHPYLKSPEYIKDTERLMKVFYSEHPELLDDFEMDDLSQHCDFYKIERYPIFHYILELKKLKITTEYVIK